MRILSERSGGLLPYANKRILVKQRENVSFAEFRKWSRCYIMVSIITKRDC